jgi:hypothetical protein
MKTLTAILFALVLAACGGGGTEEEPAAVAPIAEQLIPQAAVVAQCNGAPRVAVVYAGSAEFPALATLADACVLSTATSDPAELNAAIDQARAAAGTPRAYLIASNEGTTTALQAMSARPGYVEMSSFWYPGQVDVSRIGPSIATIHLNAMGLRTCEPLAATLRAQWVPAVCHGTIEPSFGETQSRAALQQLKLIP